MEEDERGLFPEITFGCELVRARVPRPDIILAVYPPQSVAKKFPRSAHSHSNSSLRPSRSPFVSFVTFCKKSADWFAALL